MSSEAARIVVLYERHAAAWVRAREREGTLYERPWLERFEAVMPSRRASTGAAQEGELGPRAPSGTDSADGVGVLRLATLAQNDGVLARDRASVLDLGCGAGKPIARYFAERGYAVTGVDSSATMVAMFRERLPEQEAICADMRTLGSGDILRTHLSRFASSFDSAQDLGHPERRKFDGILAWDSFFHLNHDDQRRMFPIFRQFAAPGAALMFTSGSSHVVAMGEFEGEPLFHASLNTEEYRELLGAAGFEVVAHVVEDDRCGGRTVWLARLR